MSQSSSPTSSKTTHCFCGSSRLTWPKLDARAYGPRYGPGRRSSMANDGVCDGSDLQHLLFDADMVEAQLLAALDVLSLHPATPRRSTLRADANGPITRSCASRQREVVRIISLAHGLASVVRVFADMGVIGQKYAYESAATAGPLVQVERTLTTAAPRPGPRRSLSPGPGYPPTAPPSRGCGAPSGPLPA